MQSFPHRHGDATGKPATRDKTRGCKKTSISCETSSNIDIFHTLSNRLECHKVPRLPRKTTGQPAWKHSKRTCFPASPIDTATPQENQRLETRHVDAEKPPFRTRPPPILTFLTHHQTGWNVTKCHACTQNDMTTSLETFEKDRFCSFPHRHGEATGKPETRDETRLAHQNEHFVRDILLLWHFAASKSTFSYEFSLEPENLQPQNRCFVRGFRQSCHHLTQPCQCDLQKNAQQETSKVLRLPRKMTMDTSKVLRLPRKLQHIF